MTPTPSAQNSGHPNTSANPQASSTGSYSYPHQNPAPSDSSSASRFNSFSLPPYRNLHPPAPESTASSSVTVASFQHNPFTPHPTVADPDSRHHSISSSASNYPQQQLLHSQLLGTASTTPSSSSYAGSAAKTAGGGGGSGSAGSGVPNLSLGQVHLLVATINDRNYEAKLKEILRITDSNMDVNARVLRKLINDTYRHTNAARGNDFKVLADMVKYIASHPQTAKQKFADAITPDAPEPSKIFRDFDLVGFLNQLGLDALQKALLAVAFKDHPMPDLQKKGLDVLRKSFASMLEILANPSKHLELDPEAIASFLNQLLSDPVPDFLDHSQILRVSYAARSRYKHASLPYEVSRITDPIEHMRRQEALVTTMEHIGPDSVKTIDKARELLARKSGVQITEQEVADILVLMATWRNPGEWNVANFVDALQVSGNLAQNFDWAVVIDHLDRDNFVVDGPPGFLLLLEAVQRGTRNPEFPIGQLWGGRWKFHAAQWTILHAFLKAEELDVSQLPGLRRVLSPDDFANATNTLKAAVATFERQKLISFDAIDSLLHLALEENVLPDISSAAQNELDRAAKFTPELILCGAVLLPRPWATSVQNIVWGLFDMFFENHPSYQLVFWRLWQIDRELCLTRFLEHYHTDSRRLTRILDIAQDLRCLGNLLDLPDVGFVLDAAALASRREYLNLDKWLREMLAKHGGDFWAQCYRFLRVKADAEYLQNREQVKQSTTPLTVGPVHTFLTALDDARPPVNQDVQESITQAQRVCIQAYPRLINMGQGFDHIILNNNHETNTFPAQIDKDMQAHYRKLYAQETEIRDLVNYMQELKSSTIPEDQDLFACMVHGLFDEYDCYPNYPIHALATTSVLFGSIIQFKVIDNIPLRVALAMVYQAVRDHTTSSSMYKFGLQALTQFKGRLKEWRSYCGLLSQVPGLQGTDVWNAVQEVVAGSTGQAEPDEEDSQDKPNGSEPPPTVQPFRSLSAGTLQDAYRYEDPAEDIQDKVLFIVNNVSQSNLDNKLRELSEWLEETHYQWFADYLVAKRAKMEPNYHGLYLDLLDKFGKKTLSEAVLHETYVNVIKLLNAESTLNSTVERAHLKNLGSWLGGLTIARDKPIKFKNISFKDLLIEGWESDRLIIVLPFACKVLAQAAKSNAFRPPNPWMMAIIRLLKELYDNVALKTILKFEIELLYTALELDLKTIEPGTDIQEIKERQALKLDEVDDSGAAKQLENLSLQHAPEYSELSNQIPQSFTDNIAINSVIRDNSVKRLIAGAIERTAHEIIGPVVERSVAIATIATAQLIQKDFATEPDENKMRTAAVGMAQRLAGHLALVTCKEPMRLTMVNNIRNVLPQSGFNDNAVSEQAIQMVVNDNLDYVCRTVESAAERGAVPGVEEALQGAYQLRRRYREQRTGQPFIAPDVSRYALQLPDVFRLKPGGLTPQQLSVYEEFARPTATTTNEGPRGQSLDGIPTEYLPGSLQGTAGGIDTATVDQRPLEPVTTPSPPQIHDSKVQSEKIAVAIGEMRKAAKESEEHMQDLPPDHVLFQYTDGILRHIAMLQSSAKVRESLYTSVASMICNQLYLDALAELEVEALVFLLRRLCEQSPTTAKEVVMWLASDKEDDRIFNVLTTVNLLRSQLLSVPQLDNTLAKLINERRPQALEFLGKLLEETRRSEPPILYRTDFAASFNAVGTWIRQDPSNQAARALWDGLQVSDQGSPSDDDQHEQNEYIFTEWVQLTQHNSTTDKNYSAFILQLHQKKIVSTLPATAGFIRTCIEFCLDEYESTNRTGASIATNCYIPTDALAKVVMYLVKYQDDDSIDDSDGNGKAIEQMDKVRYLNSLLALVVFIFNHYNETKSDDFCHKVFFRFFSSLLFEFRLHENDLNGHRDAILKTFAECFLTLQPTFFPTFTFHWVTLISHRYFMPRLLSTEQGQIIFTRLLTTFLGFLGDLLSKSQQPMPNVVKLLHQGALRLLLVIHHDFPGYLAEYYFPIVDAVPSECTQLRNLILSAIPPTLSDFPDPFAGGLQIKHLPEIRIAPKVLGDIIGALAKDDLKDTLDTILRRTQASGDEVAVIIERLEMDNEGSSADINAINSLVLYVGMKGVESAITRGTLGFDPDSVHASLFSRLAIELKPYGRHLFLSAITNQLRYPNSHTYYFSNLLLHLFDCANGHPNEEKVREQIGRVLMERLVVHRPHPWGLIVTLLDLFRNRREEVWNLKSVRQSPEIQRLLNTVLQQIDNSPPRP